MPFIIAVVLSTCSAVSDWLHPPGIVAVVTIVVAVVVVAICGRVRVGVAYRKILKWPPWLLPSGYYAVTSCANVSIAANFPTNVCAPPEQAAG